MLFSLRSMGFRFAGLRNKGGKEKKKEDDLTNTIYCYDRREEGGIVGR
jgi:hypothetical protein